MRTLFYVNDNARQATIEDVIELGFVKCDSCGELTAHAYVRLVGDRKMCIPCSGYDR